MRVVKIYNNNIQIYEFFLYICKLSDLLLNHQYIMLVVIKIIFSTREKNEKEM